MKRTLALATLSSLALLIAPSMAGAKVRTLRASYVNFFFQIVDNPPLQPSASAPPSPGDVAILRARYTAGGRVVAYERTSCTVVDWPNVVCNINIALRGGHIISTDQFNAMSRATQRLAITGGTGAYRNARGEILLRQTGETTGVVTFVIIT